MTYARVGQHQREESIDDVVNRLGKKWVSLTDDPHDIERIAAHVRSHPDELFTLYNRTPLLHYACHINNPTLIQACVSQPTAATLVHEGQQPIHNLVRSLSREHSVNVAPLLAAGADINAPDENGSTPLLWATNQYSTYHHPGLLKHLLAHGADPNRVNQFGTTPLHNLLANRAIEDTEVLLRAGANVLAVSHNGLAPVSEAMTPEQLEALIAHGADINQQDALGVSQLCRLVRQGQRTPTRSTAIALKAGASLQGLQNNIDEIQTAYFIKEWQAVAPELDQHYKIQGLVVLMCEGGPLTPWATKQLTAFSER